MTPTTDSRGSFSDDPQDFKPYAEPRPDIGHRQDLARVYAKHRRDSQRVVDAAASDFLESWKILAKR